MASGNLILSRHLNESIVIGDDIAVTVVEIRGGKVRLSVAAPKGVEVDRLEIRLAKLKGKSDGEAKTNSGN